MTLRPGDQIPHGVLFSGTPSWAPPDSDAYRPTTGAGPVERLRAVAVPLPCSSCAKADLCELRPTVEAIAFREPVAPHPAIAIETRIEVTCSLRRARRGFTVMPVETRQKIRDAWTPERRAAAAIRITALNRAGKAGKQVLKRKARA